MGHIFISYSHKDSEYVRKLEQALKQEGFDVWIDERIDYGTRWPQVIQEQLDACDAFVVVASKNSFQSEWVQHEVVRAQRKRKPFFPLLLDGDAWLSIESTQYVDVRGGKLPPSSFYNRLEKVVLFRRKPAQVKSGVSSPSQLPRIHPDRLVAEKPVQAPKATSPKQKTTEASQPVSPKKESFRDKAKLLWERRGSFRKSGLFPWGLIVLALFAGIVLFGFIQSSLLRAMRPTLLGPTPTYTLTPTALNATRLPIKLEKSYTPTPLYVNTPRSPLSADIYRSVKVAYDKGDWDTALQGWQEIVQLEPQAADAYYYIGEAYRFKGDPDSALEAYQQALGVDPNFGAVYVGMARARLMNDPDANVESLLDEAIRLDRNFGEAYLERAIVRTRDDDIAGALSDIGEAEARLPNSPLVYYQLAQMRVKQGDLEMALSAARRANGLDVTYLPTYRLLGQIHAAQGNEEEAIGALGIYLLYKPEDLPAYLLLGKMYYDTREYGTTVDVMNKIIALDKDQHEPYYYRFLSNVELEQGALADEDMDTVLQFYPDSFDVQIAVLRTHLLQGRNGDALLSIEKAKSLAATDQQKASAYYWSARVHEARAEKFNATKYWQLLLKLPASAMSSEMRKEAQQHLEAPE